MVLFGTTIVFFFGWFVMYKARENIKIVLLSKMFYWNFHIRFFLFEFHHAQKKLLSES